jgi:hypothetical protein
VTGNPRNQLSDDELLRLVSEMLDDHEPLPLGAVEFASQAFIWRDVNTELAQLLHDSARELVEVRATATARLLTFQARDVTLDIEHDPDGVRGAVDPPAEYRVQMRNGGRTDEVVTDSAGMFQFDSRIEGSVQFAVLDARGTCVLLTPSILL